MIKTDVLMMNAIQPKDVSTTKLTVTITMHVPLKDAITFSDVFTPTENVMMQHCVPEIAAILPLEIANLSLITLSTTKNAEEVLAKMIVNVLLGESLKILKLLAKELSVIEIWVLALLLKKKIVHLNANPPVSQPMLAMMLNVF